MIDTLLRQGYQSDTNIYLVHFLKELGEALIWMSSLSGSVLHLFFFFFLFFFFCFFFFCFFFCFFYFFLFIFFFLLFYFFIYLFFWKNRGRWECVQSPQKSLKEGAEESLLILFTILSPPPPLFPSFFLFLKEKKKKKKKNQPFIQMGRRFA